MPYVTGEDLVQDVLFRGGEISTSPDWTTKVVDYLNRVYNTLCSGASEFLPEYIEDWWWLRGSGVLTLEPIIQTGTVQVTQDSSSITFSDAPASSVAGWRFKIDTYPESYLIDSHTGGVATATLDSPFNGSNAAAVDYRLMKVEYSLDSEVASVLSPMVGFRQNPRIIGLSPERMDQLYPIPELIPGVSTAFSLEDVQTVRFSHGGRTDGKHMRIEYRYKKLVTPLTNNSSSVPLVPARWRHILADMALTYVLLDKNDDRSNAIALAARTGLAGMLKENRRQLAKMGGDVGQIYPRTNVRGARNALGPLRTESGLIIG